MIKFYAVLAIMCLSTSAFYFEHDDCPYDYRCIVPGSKRNKSYIDQLELCSKEHIPKVVTADIMQDERNISSRGIVKMVFPSPKIQCKYRVTLYVNSNINNAKDCENHKFNRLNSEEIHTIETDYCPRNENDEREMETIETELSSCKDTLIIFFENVYTGCYRLGFQLKNDFIFADSEFLETEYKKVEVTKPNLRCTYKPILHSNESSLEMAAIAADISLLAASSILRLQVAPAPLMYRNEKVGCYHHSERTVVNFDLEMSVENDTDVADNNCSLITKSLSSGDLVKKVECNFIIQNSPKNTGYCFIVKLLDMRCEKNTSWKPPKENIFYPCVWVQDCIMYEPQKTTEIEEIKDSNDRKPLRLPIIMYLIIVVVVLLVIVLIASLLYCCYRFFYVQRKKNHITTKIKTKDFEDEGSNVLELGGSKSQKEKLVKETGIVILYVRESDQLMTFMSEFRKCLKQHTDCDIYDWWAPEMWNEVARIGGYEWVVKMIRKDCRVIWIDTLKARTLFVSQHKNGYNKFKQLKQSWHSQEISDFRDSIFPAIVDFAKRNNQDIEQEYQRHFVVRLETFENADKTEDPFADLSPHARFLIPCHLDKLCSQLAVRELYLEDEMSMDKIHLRKYLQQDCS